MTLYKKVAIELIAQERERQIEEEGYTAQYDDEHGAEYYEELICAGETYEREVAYRGDLELWPWPKESFKPSCSTCSSGRVKELTKAGALYLAAKEQIERNGKEHKGQMFLPYINGWIDRVANKIVELMPEHSTSNPHNQEVPLRIDNDVSGAFEYPGDGQNSPDEDIADDVKIKLSRL